MASIPDIVLDHVAVALERQADAWPRYAGDLPATYVGGGATAGFDSAQVQYGNGMKVEVLEPFEPERNDFLRRFLDRNGPGPHHLTFKVADLAGALRVVEDAGYRPVGVELSSPWWKEAFLHPKDAPGVVVQLAQSGEGGDWGNVDALPSWFPDARVASLAELVHVAHAVADKNEGRRLFVDLLGGEVVDEVVADADSGAPGVAALDVSWPGGGTVRLLHGPAITRWLGGRTGRVHHLAFVTELPAFVPDAELCADAVGEVCEVAPEHNFGMRLLLASEASAFREHPLGYVPLHGRTH